MDELSLQSRFKPPVDIPASASVDLDAAQVGAWDLDLGTNTVVLSPLAARLMGLPKGGPIPLDEWLGCVCPEDRADLEHHLRGTTSGGSSFVIAFRWVTPAGETRWREARGRSVPASGSAPAAAAGVIFDITERKQEEERLREQSAVLKEVLQALPVGVWLLGKDGTILQGNPTGERIWAGARFVGPEQFREYVGWWADTGEAVQPHEWAGARAIERGETSIGEVIDIRDFSGDRKTILHSAVPLRNRLGEITGAVVTNQDITNHRRTEEALRDSEERFRSIFNQSAVSISVIGLDGRFIDANPMTCRLLGYDPAEMEGKPMAQVIHPDDLPLTSQSFDKMLRGEQTSYHVVRRYLRKDGSIVWGRATTSVVSSGAGEPKYLVTVAEDVSEQKRAEEAERLQTDRMRLLAETAAELLESADTSRIIENIYERVADHVGADVYLHHAVSPDGGRLVLQFCKGLSPSEQSRVSTLEQEPDSSCGAALRDIGVRACCTYPLLSLGEPVASLTLGFRSREAVPADALEFIRTISHYVGLAIERIRLTQKLNERIEQYSHLIATQREIAQAEPDLAARMHLLAARVQQIAQSSGAGITRIEDEQVEYIAGSGTLEAVVGLRVSMYDSLVGRAVQENQPLRSDDTAHDSRVHREACEVYAIRSMIAVPLQYNSATVGALTVVSDRPNAFNDDHMAFAEVMSSIVVAAMSAVAEAETREALSTAEERLRLALEGASIGIWSWDLVSDTVYASPEALTLLGHDPNLPISAKRSIEHIHPDDREAAVRSMRRVLAEQSTYEMQYRFMRPDGSIHWVASRGRVIRGADGTPMRLEGVVIDITEQKRLQEQLLQAQKMEGIGRLAGGIAHDFNNLLSVILGYAELIQMDLSEQSPFWSSLRNIQSAATRAATLTKQLLAFARRQAADPKVIDLNELILGMGEMLRPLLGEHIDLRVNIDAYPATVKIDPNQMEQVIVNLAVNARDAMPDGGSLLLRTENVVLDGGRIQDEVGVIPGDYVRLSVSDTGHGMSPEVMARLFEPFFTTKERGKGTGLGLATCYGIVRQNAGYIWPYSEPAIGTTFKVFLPTASERPKNRNAPAPQSATTQGSATVLVVEDEDLVRELVVGALRSSGYTVLAATDGKEGLEVATNHPGPIHLLLSDLIMPRMGGEELAQELRKLRPEVRVAFVSGYSEDIATLKGLLRPDTPLFEKPIAPSDLLARIAEMLIGGAAG